MPSRRQPPNGTRFRSADELRAALKTAIGLIRHRRGLSIDALAEHSTINKRQLEKLAGGKALGSIVTLAKLARALNVTLDDLFAPPDRKASLSSRAHEAPLPRSKRHRPATEAQLETLQLEARRLDGHSIELLIQIARRQS